MTTESDNFYQDIETFDDLDISEDGEGGGGGSAG